MNRDIPKQCQNMDPHKEKQKQNPKNGCQISEKY